MRVLLRHLSAEGWQADRPRWEIDGNGFGHAVYRVRGSGQTYCLVAFAHDLPDDQRSDRVIAEAWDATFALVDGEPTPDDIARLAANVPLQEAGRVSDRELVLSRANKSVRLWDHVVDCLAAGRQPDPARVQEVGYLMRTTAVYGSGKFGAADFATLRSRPVLGGPFRAEMLAVWLIRAFVMDLVEHVARFKGGAKAAVLDPDLRRQFGIGNSTGLGMAPFLVTHPSLLNAWITARETALARVRGLTKATPETREVFATTLAQSRRLVDKWHTSHPLQAQKTATLRTDLALLEAAAPDLLRGPDPWNALYIWAEQNLSLEGQEMVVSLVIEPHGPLVDDLADQMAVDEDASFRIDGQDSTKELAHQIEQTHAWALNFNASATDTARFWYTSAAKLEPRLGERAREPGADLELPLATARDISALAHDLRAAGSMPLAAFLANHPQHRHSVRRIQRSAKAPYSEIHDNLIAADMLPIDMLRCKLAFFGATRFDPRSDRWLRITMFQGAPFPSDLGSDLRDDWIFPQGPVVRAA